MLLLLVLALAFEPVAVIDHLHEKDALIEFVILLFEVRILIQVHKCRYIFLRILFIGMDI